MTPLNFTPLTGIVLIIGLRDVKFNFGYGPVEVPMWAIDGQDYEGGMIGTFHILTEYVEKHHLTC